ncbi:SIR2 family protein, partial [uncultured Chryseobacterium sp.]|uniref:SIR2 family protein n=1 Tax=uncultured Chryseobacterium sp. TaxID=259322 RepID=UPI0025EBBD05
MEQSKFFNDISLIKEAINNDRLVVFAGAGVSKDSGIPLWGELINEVKKYLNEDTKETDALKIAQMLYNEKGEKEYNEILKKLIYKGFRRYNELHEIIFKLRPQHIITTNYDPCFEEVINLKGLPYSIVSKDLDLPYAKFKNLLIKYHGDFENHNIVFKENDYLDFSKNHTLKEIFVKSLFSNKIILFIGYSVGDVNLKILIKDIQYILNKHHQRAYLLNHNEMISESEIKYYENLGINIIKFDKILNFENDKIDLSITGKKVYSLIDYISDKFHINNYKNSLTNIKTDQILINELYKSISKFYYFRRLPKYIISNLYPINKNTISESNSKYNGQYLITDNKQLYEFFENYEGYKDKRYDKETIDNINSCITRLVNSGFNYLVLNVDKNNLHSKNIDLISKIRFDKSCDCINCSLDVYDFSIALSKINKYEITNQTSLWDDLTYSYSQYQICDYYKSYNSFKQIEVKANQLKVMEVSFLAKYNMKRLGLQVMNSFFIEGYDFHELKDIFEESKNIDLEEELTRVKYFVDEDVYLFLKEIKDGIFIQKLCNDIDQEVVNVSENLEKIKNGGIRSDSSVENLYDKTVTLYSFLNDNFILGNGFSLIEHSFSKSLKTFILAYYMGTLKLDEQQIMFGLSHLRQFDSLLINILIEKADCDEIHKLIQERKLNDIKISNNGINSIYNSILNFLKSPVNQDDLSKKFTKNNIFYSHTLKNNNFRKKQKRIFANICLVIANFNFNSKQLNELLENVNVFIKYQDVNYLLEESNIRYVIKNKYKIIHESVLIE